MSRLALSFSAPFRAFQRKLLAAAEGSGGGSGGSQGLEGAARSTSTPSEAGSSCSDDDVFAQE